MGRLLGIIIIITAVVCALLPIRATFPAYAQETDIRGLTGTVYIKGDKSEVEWDDIGVVRWTAQGNVYMRYTSAEGDIVEIHGDRLDYERRTSESGQPAHWVSISGNVQFNEGEYSINAGKFEGYIDPLDIEASIGVEFKTEQLEISSEELTFSEKQPDVEGGATYLVSVPGDASALFKRLKKPAPPPPPQNQPILPIPIDLNMDFDTMTMAASDFELEFNDDGFLDGFFPKGGEAETDTGYNFTGKSLYFCGWSQICAYNCTITGPDVEMYCLSMSFYPDEKRLELNGSVTFTTDEGVLSMDSLVARYDDDGVSELTASGNVKIDLKLILGEDIMKKSDQSQIEKTEDT